MEYGKYIIIDNMGIPCPIMFSPLLSHAEIAKESKVISAGFFEVFLNNDKEIKINVFGKSTTLKIDRNKNDEEILRKVLVYQEYEF